MSDVTRVTAQRLRFERLLDAPVETVWAYLVDPALRARWFMGGPTDLRVGGSIGMTMEHDRLSDGDVPTPERYRTHLGKCWTERITRLDPPNVLAFTWDDGAAGEVTITLRAQQGGTLLVLIHDGLRGLDDAHNFGGGWHAHLAALARRVRGDGVADFWALHGQAEGEIERALGDGPAG
ncbi:SRPBCC family protein [Polymorphobacter sp.]|uniref:SRPBCC family protein n=1 Tax=Polymorphobacter sp. TaxID=1909290 RepID=UPI003F7289E5